MVAPSDQDEVRGDTDMPSWRRSLGEAGPYLGLGMQIALSMALFVGIGYAVDVWLNILPWGTVAGALIGMVAVFYHLLRVLDEMNRASSRNASSREKKQRSSPSDRSHSGGAAPDREA